MKILRKNFDRNYFENFAYRSKTGSQRNLNRIKEIFHYHHSGKLLDVGCGLGGFLQDARQYFEVSGCDLSAYAVEYLRPEFGEHVWKQDIEQEALTSNDYDVIAAFNLLEHLPSPRKAIQRIYPALSERGIFIGSVPNRTPLIGSLHTLLTNFFDRTHCSTYSPRVWRKAFRKTGFERIHFFGEVVIGGNFCFYIHHRLWPRLALNLMFVCEK